MADGPRDRPGQGDMMTKPRHLNQEEEREGVLPQGPTGHSFRVLPGNFSHISSSSSKKDHSSLRNSSSSRTSFPFKVLLYLQPVSSSSLLDVPGMRSSPILKAFCCVVFLRLALLQLVMDA